ncbi:MAG: hypothetical protein VX527_01795 [Planctomycetota bacterium]|nr:hypothetical protein [Planctomycetota bacterium]
MDRERLQQVQQSDLGESRVNEDFVNWIKTSGPWYLLAILVGIAVYMYLVNLQRSELREREQAWYDLGEAVMPASLEDVAQRHADIDGIGSIARLQAANTYLTSLQTNLALGATIEEGTPLSEEDRTLGMERADRLYTQIVNEDQGEFGDTLTTVSALNGLAAIAESRGDVDQARTYYEKAADRAATWYPILAEQARGRAATAELYAQDVILPNPPPVATPATSISTPTLKPLDIDNILNLPTTPDANSSVEADEALVEEETPAQPTPPAQEPADPPTTGNP